MEREYIVVLNKDVNYDQFWNEMENVSSTDGFVPNRRVDIVNERPGSLRSCHYALTNEEAEILRSDSRIYSVEIPPQQRDDIEIVENITQVGDFTKTTSGSGSFINWGLRRCIDYNNPYGTSTTVSGGYNYLYDGTGVDIVIQDSGLQVDHPEFTDASGNSRVQQINWYTASGLPGTQSANHYRDFDGHGTHCAGIAAGKNYGWAKNSRIFSVKVSGLEGSGDSGTGISVTDCFDVIKLWHINKPIDPTTGYKRPTVVNMSWGYGTSYSNIDGGNYRGTPWAGNLRETSYGMIGVNISGVFRHNVRVGSVDADLDELISAGVIVCISAGNSFDKIDLPGGLDYDNYYNKIGVGNTYYHRGSSPYSTSAIIVGSIDSTVYSANLDQKSTFSSHGPGVSIMAPGSNIMSASSNTNDYGASDYHLNPAFKQMNISGTSMASPQVAGVAALYLGIYPSVTPSLVKNFLTSEQIVAGNDRIYSTGLDDDYTNNRSITNGTQSFLYWPYSTTPVPPSLRIRGVQISGDIRIRI
jgi:subtilisin family serine protease